jgi:hypothetical protein
MDYCKCGKPATTHDQMFTPICQDCRDEYTLDFEKRYPEFTCKGCGKTERVQYSHGLCLSCTLKI